MFNQAKKEHTAMSGFAAVERNVIRRMMLRQIWPYAAFF